MLDFITSSHKLVKAMSLLHNTIMNPAFVTGAELRTVSAAAKTRSTFSFNKFTTKEKVGGESKQ